MKEKLGKEGIDSNKLIEIHNPWRSRRTVNNFGFTEDVFPNEK